MSVDPVEAMMRVQQIEALSAKLADTLAGHGSEVQMAALADATAVWLAGHLMADQDKLDAFRKVMLDAFVDLVGTLVEPNEKLGLAGLGFRTREQALAMAGGDSAFLGRRRKQ